MGSFLEVNDTLQLTDTQGFPADLLDLERHRAEPITLADVAGRVFHFTAKDGARILHLDPVRVFLVRNLGGKWLHWGKALIQSQTIAKKLDPAGNWLGEWETSGSYLISEIYDPEYQEIVTRRESPAGKSFFS